MQKMDKTVKCLLWAIVLLLVFIAVRPYVNVSVVPEAQAQVSGVGTALGTELVNRVHFESRVEDVQVLDSLGVFLVRTQNSVEVYRINQYYQN